jgi:hypothetical protein
VRCQHRTPVGSLPSGSSPISNRAALLGALASLALLTLGCPGKPSDVAIDPPSPSGRVVADHDVGAHDGYVYVARKPHVTIALAEARGITEAEGIAMVERLAADFSGCAARLAGEGQLAVGAGRVVMIAGPRGMPEGFNVRLAPGAAIAQNALMCLIAPAKTLVFPPADASQRGLAIETTWGP